jgi:hypothetical protein
MPDAAAPARWKADPVAFVDEVLVDPETDSPFALYEAQRRFLREALRLTREGRLPYPELLFACPKKSGKTGLAAMVMIYVIVCSAVDSPRATPSRTTSSKRSRACSRRSAASSTRRRSSATP